MGATQNNELTATGPSWSTALEWTEADAAGWMGGGG